MFFLFLGVSLTTSAHLNILLTLKKLWKTKSKFLTYSVSDLIQDDITLDLPSMNPMDLCSVTSYYIIKVCEIYGFNLKPPPLKTQICFEAWQPDAPLCGPVSESCSWLIPVKSMAPLVVPWAASHIVACGEHHCTGSTGIEAYYWPPSQALLTKLILWNKYNIENHIYA